MSRRLYIEMEIIVYHVDIPTYNTWYEIKFITMLIIGDTIDNMIEFDSKMRHQ